MHRWFRALARCHWRPRSATAQMGGVLIMSMQRNACASLVPAFMAHKPRAWLWEDAGSRTRLRCKRSAVLMRSHLPSRAHSRRHLSMPPAHTATAKRVVVLSFTANVLQACGTAWDATVMTVATLEAMKLRAMRLSAPLASVTAQRSQTRCTRGVAMPLVVIARTRYA